MPAGGPHTLTRAHRDANTQTANDVLVGDVWLCSGQSNMEWPVRNTLDAGSEVALSANDRIRHVTIARATSAAPRTDFDAPLEWKVAGPATTEHFSAVCYYFVRELQKTVNVPQGIISSNWGGSRIEPWMSEAALRHARRLPAAARLVRRVPRRTSRWRSGTGARSGRSGGTSSAP